MTIGEALAILGVEWGTTDANFIARARRNWRRLILLEHPDRGGDPERAKLLNQAMEVVRTMGTPAAEPHVYYSDMQEVVNAMYLAMARFTAGFDVFRRAMEKDWPDWGHTS